MEPEEEVVCRLWKMGLNGSLVPLVLIRGQTVVRTLARMRPTDLVYIPARWGMLHFLSTPFERPIHTASAVWDYTIYLSVLRGWTGEFAWQARIKTPSLPQRTPTC